MRSTLSKVLCYKFIHSHAIQLQPPLPHLYVYKTDDQRIVIITLLYCIHSILHLVFSNFD